MSFGGATSFPPSQPPFIPVATTMERGAGGAEDEARAGTPCGVA